jgi:hypothetical protein
VSREEFETLGFLCNFSKNAVRRIYEVFDVTGNSELESSEFRLFVFAAIDMVRPIYYVSVDDRSNRIWRNSESKKITCDVLQCFVD